MLRKSKKHPRRSIIVSNKMNKEIIRQLSKLTIEELLNIYPDVEWWIKIK